MAVVILLLAQLLPVYFIQPLKPQYLSAYNKGTTNNLILLCGEIFR
jgi:hypothetical protein